jgi:hypothetical protein
MSRVPPTRGIRVAGHRHEWDRDGRCTIPLTIGRCFAEKCRAPDCDVARSAPVDFCADHRALARQLTMPAHRPRIVKR